MSVIYWENAAVGRVEPGRKLWALVAVELRRHPGVWVEMLAAKRSKGWLAANFAQKVKRGKAAPFRPAGSFQAKSWSDNDKTYAYARYVGQVKQ